VVGAGLFFPTVQYLPELGVLDHRDDLELHQIAPGKRELGQGLAVVAFEHDEPAAEIRARPAAEELRTLRAGPPVALNRAIASSRPLASGLMAKVSMKFKASSRCRFPQAAAYSA
jgi:hypothetical protein